MRQRSALSLVGRVSRAILERKMMKPYYRRHFWVYLLVMAGLALGLAPVVHAKVSNPEKLVAFLKIDLPGWQVKAGYPKLARLKDKDKGQPYVEAQVLYTSGKSILTAVIMEGPGVSVQVAEVRKFPMVNNEKGYCRKTAVQGFEAVELYEKAKKTGYFFIFVAAEGLITMEAKEVGSTQVLKDLASKIDLPGLAALVK